MYIEPNIKMRPSQQDSRYPAIMARYSSLLSSLDARVYTHEYVRTFFFTHDGPHRYYHATCFSDVSQAFPRLEQMGSLSSPGSCF